MSAALAYTTNVLDFASPSAMSLAAERHNRTRRIRKVLYWSLMPTRPVDVLTIASLGVGVSDIWWRLMARLWLDGHLPGEPVALAQAARVCRRRWKRDAPALEGMFQRTTDGDWTNHELIAFRDQVIARFDAVEARLGVGAVSKPPLQQEGRLVRAFANSSLGYARAGEPPPLTIQFWAECSAQLEMTPRERQAWRLLLLHLLEHGRLPTDRAALARICRLRISRFKAMERMLALHLDRDVDGSWTHIDVIAGRGNHPVRLVGIE